MELFLKLGTDPYEVIRLFPDLVTPSTYNDEHNEPAPNQQKLQDLDLERGLRALIVFLTEIRHTLMAKDKEEKKKDKEASNAEKSITVVATEQLLKIIDTTLLKCYLQVKKNG